MLLNCGVGENSWVPQIARRSTQSILKEINPEYSLEGLMLKLKLQCLATSCEELTHWKRPWCWERLKAGGEGDNPGQDGWISSLTQWTWVWANSRDGEGQGSLVCCSPWGCKGSDMTEHQQLQEQQGYQSQGLNNLHPSSLVGQRFHASRGKLRRSEAHTVPTIQKSSRSKKEEAVYKKRKP